MHKSQPSLLWALTRAIRPSPTLVVAVLGSLSLVIAPVVLPLRAQVEKNDRKLVRRVEPDYPPDLKQMGIGGYVRIEATISPAGIVESVILLGGNPILGEAAIKAVKKWKYVVQDSQTKAQVTFHFSP